MVLVSGAISRLGIDSIGSSRPVEREGTLNGELDREAERDANLNPESTMSRSGELRLRI